MSQLQKYNGMDTIATFQIWTALQSQFRPDTRAAYHLLKALSGPSLYMMLRGILVDQDTIEDLKPKFDAECKQLEDSLDFLTQSLDMGVINLAAPVQVKWLFECLGAKLPTKRFKGETKTSVGRDTLEQVAKSDPELAPVANLVLAWRDRKKMLQVLNPELVDADGRMRTTYKIAGTTTTRWSSSKNALWTGMNMQNIKRDEDEKAGHASIRSAFVADPGYKLVNIDLERADSWAVALEVFKATGDLKYFNACGSKDLHTYVSKLVWPGLGWTDDEDANIAIAKQFFYRQYDYRFMSKKGGHGCVPEDHEVLTPSGWVSIAEKPAIIMASTIQGLAWSHVTHWTDYDYKGELINLKGTSLSLRATPNHRIILTYSQKEGIFREVEAENFTHGYIPLGQGYVGGTHHERYARLIAAIQADGHIASTNRVKFHLRKQRKIQNLMEICDEVGVDLWASGNETYTIDFCMEYPKNAGPYLLEWDIKSLKAWRNELRSWDGSIGATSAISTHSIHLDHVEWVQTINRLLGYGGNIQKPTISGFGSTIYKVMENSRKFADGGRLNKTVEQFKGRVYCPTVSSGMFLVKHDNRIHVTGNSNYLGKGRTLAIQMKIPIYIAENFQHAYFKEFPGIKKWHSIKAKELQTTGQLTNLFGIRRNFHNRLDADATLREAIAFLGQSVTAGAINRVLLRLWACQLQMPQLGMELLGQVHDSLFWQIPEEQEAEMLDILPWVTKAPIVVSHGDRQISQAIPVEVSTGWNLSGLSPSNPDGLKKVKASHDDRTRVHWPKTKKLGFMDRRLSSLYRRPQQPSNVPEVGSDIDDWCMS